MPPSPRRPRRRTVQTVDSLRFAAGWRRVQGDLEAVTGGAGELGPGMDPGIVAAPILPRDEPGIRFDIIRPIDLVALSVRAVGCDLVTGGATPAHLVAREGEPSRLVVSWAFQHGFEQAIYESAAPVADANGEPATDPLATDGEAARPIAPVGFRPARASRLVFAIPDGETIEFSSAGILAAMSRLELVVHPLAHPGDAPQRGSLGTGFVIGPFDPSGPIIHVGEGLVARIGAAGPQIERATKAILRDHPVPDTSTLAGLAQQARALRRARTMATRATPSIAARTKVPEGSIFAPGGGLVPDITIPRPPRRTLSRPPTGDETAIEAPYRLVISPSIEARWAHASEPVAADDQPDHVELWHSRLANAPASDDTESPDEHNHARRIIRAIWARDRDMVGDAWEDTSLDTDPVNNPLSHADPRDPANNVDPPFLGSLDRFDRHMLVRQSSETWPGDDGSIAPVPVGADALWLSGLGAWLDLHGAWTTKPYSEVQMSSILSWDHVAPMGRDQYVRVVYPGYLYPFGHQAALVKVTERKMKDLVPSVAGLYQRMFLVIGERVRTYTGRNFPFTTVAVRPLVTPVIDKPGNAEGNSQETFFWPLVGGQHFAFVLDAIDHVGHPVRLQTPLVWVSEAYNATAQRTKADNDYAAHPNRRIEVVGQKVSFVPRADGPDTDLETERMWLLGEAGLGISTPRMSAATVTIPAVQQLSPTTPIPIEYDPEYVDKGFGTSTTGEVWARSRIGAEGAPPQADPAAPLKSMAFGQGAPSGSDKAGGFLNPDLPLAGLSRVDGPIGDPGGVAAGEFDPVAFLQGALPKLFGLISLADLIAVLPGLDQAPAVVSETLGRIEAFLADIQRAVDAAQRAVDEANALVTRAQGKSADLQALADQAVTKAQDVATDATDLGTQVVNLFGTLTGLDPDEIEAAVAATFDDLRALIVSLRELAALLPPQVAATLEQIADALTIALDAQDLVQDIFDFINGFDPSDLEVRFRFEWTPQIQEWPVGDPIFELADGSTDNLVLAVEGHASGKGEVSVTTTAELRDFALMLFPGAPLMRVPFDHMSFKAGTSGKAEVDVVLGEIEFLGILSFIEVIKDLIPLDGFSDPPFLEVSPAGLTAGFTQTLPTVAIGVFSLSNMSLGADVHVPFLGEVVSVGFNFCTRERPFTLTVMCLGGGGWFLIRVSPNGLDVLELGLEAGASLSVDFGVASGSISAMVGIYLRLEGEVGSLTGYFRLRGEVDVLGLISASIELYMELVYEFDTGKMVGRATITVEVEVLVFSGSVSITAERQLAGSNGDPSYREILGAEDGTSPAWSTYCSAFAGE